MRLFAAVVAGIAILVFAILIIAYIDAGREEPRLIEEDVPVPTGS